MIIRVMVIVVFPIHLFVMACTFHVSIETVYCVHA